MSDQLNCPKCGKTMQEGFIPGLPNRGENMFLTWIAGPPEKGLFAGLKSRQKERLRVRTFRCIECGYLESYANKSD